MLSLLTLFALLITFGMRDSVAAVWILALGQSVLLLDHILKRQVSAVGAFIFMSFLFFGVRPLFLVYEDDYRLFTDLFKVRTDQELVNLSMWWGTAAMLCFYYGAKVAGMIHQNYFGKRARQSRNSRTPAPLVTNRMVQLLLAYQVATLFVMAFLASSGRGLYNSAIGAYLYDLPMLLQAGHVFSLVAILERWMRMRNPVRLALVVISGVMFMMITWLMREVTIFRGFYVTGVMIAGIAVLARLKPRVSYAWLILPIVLLQPMFRTLGETRTMTNEELGSQSLKERVFGDGGVFNSYWAFYDSKGDMNIFDTFAAAMEAKPTKHPYVLTWLYVPVHLVPRAVWKSKPEKGILQDVSFMNGAPYSPGIAGFFLLDGGRVWMLGCLATLGYILSYADGFLRTMPRSYLRCCLIAIITVNAMFLTRFYLWQWFYQVLYSCMPCVFLAFILDRKPLKEHFGIGVKTRGSSGGRPRRPQLPKPVEASNTLPGK